MSNYFVDKQQNIGQQVAEILGVSVDDVQVEIANESIGAHLAVPCFRFSKALKKSPAEIAGSLAESLQIPDASKVVATGPYVSIWLEPQAFAGYVAEHQSTLTMDHVKKNDKTVIVEYVSANLAKPLSVGHLRNALQGRTLERLYKTAGYNVVTDNHIGDWGTVFGMWVVGFESFGSEEALAKDGVKELGRVYVAMRNALKTEKEQGGSELADSIQDWLMRLEAGDDEAWKYHRRFTDISLGDLSAQLAKLDIYFDENIGESFYIERAKRMIANYVKDGVAIAQDDNSIIIPLDDQGIETPMLVQKSNGASLYHTSDIATISYREERWSPDKVIYVVGMEQKFHFDQLFAYANKVNATKAELVHYWYGLIEERNEDGTTSKMSSRKNAIYLSDMYDRAIEKAQTITDANLSEDDIKAIAMGALSFREFSQNHTHNIVFDWESMFSLTGHSGPYVQYAAVRMGSLLAKADGVDAKPAEGYGWESEAALLWLLVRYPQIVEDAIDSREPYKIAQYAYSLAKVWNQYYEKTSVMDAAPDEKNSRLWLIQQMKSNMEHALYLLGITIPSKM